MAGHGGDDKGLPVGSLDQIMGADDIKADGVPVEVPEWGVTVLVRGLTRSEATAWSAIEDQQSSDVHLLRCALVSPTLTEEQASELVTRKSAAAVRRVLTEVIEVSGLGATFREGQAA